MMIAQMYKRREKAGYLFLILLILLMIGWLLFFPPKAKGEWVELLFFLLPIAYIISVIMISRSQYEKVRQLHIPTSEQSLIDLDHVVIKKDATFIKRLLLFEKDGKFIGEIRPYTISWWMYPFLILDSSIIDFFPLTYQFVTHDGKRKFSFRKKDEWKRLKLTIFDEEQHKIGTYIQEEWKSLFSIKGELVNEKEEPILSIVASGFSGDFKWSDEEGNVWAYFYNGKFPHEYTTIFRDSKNDIVELSNELSLDDKIRLLAVISYLFLARIKQ